MFLCSQDAVESLNCSPTFPGTATTGAKKHISPFQQNVNAAAQGKLSIPDTPSKSDSLGVPVVSGSGVLRGVSALRFLALTLVLGKACLADNRDNAVETNTQTHTYTGVTERQSHRGNSQLCAVNEKPACQDVPHSWMNKRGSGSRSPLGDTAGMRLRGKGNRMMETDRKPFLAWPMFELAPLLSLFGQTLRLMSFLFHRAQPNPLQRSVCLSSRKAAV